AVPPASASPTVPLLYCSSPSLELPSFPTRRSSDLNASIAICSLSRKPIAMPRNENQTSNNNVISSDQKNTKLNNFLVKTCKVTIDRKSTRLNSSHVKISYAVFCLKLKTPPRGNALG